MWQHRLSLFFLALSSFVTLSAFWALGGQGTGPDYSLLSDPWFWQLLGFTFKQALLSSLLAVGLALPLARLLVLDRQLPLKAFFLRWCLLCFVLPSLVLITGLILLLGRQGWLAPLLGPEWQIYGLQGILIAHVFLNLPLAIRLLSAQWASIPSQSWRLASQLQLSFWQQLYHVEWPALRPILAPLFGLIFLLCFNSFAVVLTLGGGPASSTLEVAIYQALKFDFNPGEALFLAWTQLLLAGSLFWFFQRFGKLSWLAVADSGPSWQPRPHRLTLYLGRLYYLLIGLFLSLPLLVLLPRAVQGLNAQLPWLLLLQASSWSLLLAASATLLCLSMALSLSHFAIVRGGLWARFTRLIALHQLVVPGMVLAVGVYLFFLPWIYWQDWGWLALILLNSLVALPYAFSQIQPAMFQYHQSYARLSQSLALTPWQHWRDVLWPFLKPCLLPSAGLVLVLLLGDMTLFSLFGSAHWPTLPWVIYELAGSYRLNEAALASLLLLGFSFLGLMWLERSRPSVT
ncbi:ABC transporter permease subunit [Marinospirillum sp. MEB164]|uniref:ABC transporter permease subunit n=1 Tax=Marinospirillum alkalitolerans TaxID=3123374 RepID=A0ABW8PWD8_9GAMM